MMDWRATMTNRLAIEELVHRLYDARVRGDLDALCLVFSQDAIFKIAGAGQASPVANRSMGVSQFRPLLALMIKTFKLKDHAIISMIIEGPKAAVHWRATVHSRIAGTTAATEFIDLIEVGHELVTSYTEFFVPSS